MPSQKHLSTTRTQESQVIWKLYPRNHRESGGLFITTGQIKGELLLLTGSSPEATENTIKTKRLNQRLDRQRAVAERGVTVLCKSKLFWSFKDTKRRCGDAGGAQTPLGVNEIEKPLRAALHSRTQALREWPTQTCSTQNKCSITFRSRINC